MLKVVLEHGAGWSYVRHFAKTALLLFLNASNNKDSLYFWIENNDARTSDLCYSYMTASGEAVRSNHGWLLSADRSSFHQAAHPNNNFLLFETSKLYIYGLFPSYWPHEAGNQFIWLFIRALMSKLCSRFTVNNSTTTNTFCFSRLAFDNCQIGTYPGKSRPSQGFTSSNSQ